VTDAEREIREVETDIDRQLRADGGAQGAEPAPLPPPEPAPPEPAPASPQLELGIDEPPAERKPGAA
jgi:hypothetical protein